MNSTQAMTMIVNDLCDAPLKRHADIIAAGEQIRVWREEDRRNGIEWEIDKEGEQ